ncbi:4-amino-4-deoxy-L-arabinose-phosphoundecaprenol flippase subunit ArnF [Tatumella sp. UBA2305]|uniref:4-amino-4-deoxy-L-arabinose-phosphoundecaprenol flippase subunit ArnF n=1 Tax=Tatumella sp. UBA2305 TaxID=1947647 RepID=UPI0025D606FD|nr:4-amino-4-deoxy-L-arabinose-phosphoundecaprenol flippase subunit ArnF [Tatumella sp. UBA2305]
MGYIPAICSVLLVSFAQVAMKYAMSRFPASAGIADIIRELSGHPTDAGWLLAGLAGYALSMGCWFLALKRLPLSKAYALLSLSYIIVWAIAVTLGFWGERFSLTTLAGILSVICGVMLVCMPSAKR